MADTRIGVALFGVGRAGTIHFHSLVRSPRVHLLYIVEKDQSDRAKSLVADYHLDATVLLDSEADKVYNDSRISAVVVCSPTFAHEDIVRGALSHGKAVFCEKPISDSYEGTASCYELAKKAGKPLFCSFNRRWDPTVRTLREKVVQGDLGVVHVVKTCSRDSPVPTNEYLKTSGGMFYDCGIHDIDAVCWVLREQPHTVYAQAACHIDRIRQLEDIDTAAIVLTFPSGALGIIDISRYAAYGYDQRLEAFGANGMLVSENQAKTSLVNYGAKDVTHDLIKYSFPQRYAESYVNAMDHFLDALKDGTDVEVTASDALGNLKIAAACLQSHRTGQPVKLN